MKMLTAIALLSLLLQQGSLTSAVYNWADQKVDLNGQRRYLAGNTTHFESFDVTAHTLSADAKPMADYALDKEEELVIVKEGSLNVTIGKTSKTLGPGSIAYVMPGDNRKYVNAQKKETTFYHLKFKSRTPDPQRGKSGGESFTIDWNTVEKKKTEKGRRREFFNRPTTMCTKFEMHVTTLNEGLDSHAAHTHPEEEIILLLKGNIQMEIDGKLQDASPGALVFLSSQIPHALHNVGKGECEYFAFQWK